VRHLKVAIDGPAGSGKSTVARKVAEVLGFDYLSSGLMYRYVGLLFERSGKSDPHEILKMVENLHFELEENRLKVNGVFLDEELLSERAGGFASKVAVIPEIRKILSKMQRELAEGRDIVVEGRDIGTVVLPDADLKIFLTASPEERARRRYMELRERNEKISYEDILEQIKERDAKDSSRSVAPLKPAPDAVIIDTTHMSIDEVVNKVVKLVNDLRTGGERVIFSKTLGFCWGVSRMVELIKKLLKNGEKVHTFGDVVHNDFVMNELKKMGLIVHDADDILSTRRIEGTVVIRAHGLPENEIEHLNAIADKVVDGTCPNVLRLFELGKRLENEGYRIYLFGRKDHPEVRAFLGHVAKATLIEKDTEFSGDRIALLAQTTAAMDEFKKTIFSCINEVIKDVQEMRILNTICRETIVRENEVKELAKKCDAVLVIGGKKSSNTRKLYEIAKSENNNTYLITSPDELPENLVGKLGIASGTSTPIELIREIVRKIEGEEVLKDEQ